MTLTQRLIKIYKANDDPFSTKEAFTTLNNEEGRQKEHEQLLREYGFPNEIGAEANRYVPVVETETNDKGIPINPRGPWVVNEAGNDLGESHDEDSPSFSSSEKAQNREGKKTASVSKLQKENIMTLTQRLVKLMKQGGVGSDVEKQGEMNYAFRAGEGRITPKPKPTPSLGSASSQTSNPDAGYRQPGTGRTGDRDTTNASTYSQRTALPSTTTPTASPITRGSAPGEMAAGPTGSASGGAVKATANVRPERKISSATWQRNTKPPAASATQYGEIDEGTNIPTSAQAKPTTPSTFTPMRDDPRGSASRTPRDPRDIIAMEKSYLRTPPTVPFLSKQSL